MRKRPIPTLLDTLRPTLIEIAEAMGVSRGLANFWREGKSVPKPAARRALVAYTRRHARRLLKAAEAVEREGAAAKAEAGPRRHRRRS